MPIYDYICGACAHRFEVIHGVHALGPEACPVCGEGPVTKALVAPTIHFKGSGWAKKERQTSRSGGSSRPTSDSESGSTAERGSTPDSDSGSSAETGTGSGSESPSRKGGPAAVPASGTSSTAAGATGSD